MKKDRKTTPLIAAHSANKKNHKPDSLLKENEAITRVSNKPKQTTAKTKSLTLDRITEGIVALDETMKYTYVNECAGKLLGRKPKELIGKKLVDLKSDQPPFAPLCQQALTTQTVVPFNGYFTRSDAWLAGCIYPSEDGVSVLFREDAPSPEQEIKTSPGKSEEKFSKAFHLSPSAMAIADSKESRIIDVNQSLLNLLKLESEEVLGHTLQELGITINPDDSAALARLVQERGNVRDHELAIHTRDGELHYMLISIEQIEFEGTTHNLIAAVDVTERRRAEEKLRDISKFPGENPNPIMRFTRAGELLYANEAAVPLLAFWRAEHGQSIPAELAGLLASFTHSATNIEIELEGDGKIYTCLLVPIHDTGYVNLYFRDITERKQTEESLRALINQTTAGIMRVDMDGRITFVNQTFCEMLGYSESELIGETIWEISYFDDLPKTQRLFERMRDEGEPYQLEKRLIRKNGSVLWVSVGTSPLRDANGRTYSAVSMLADITRRKRAEESLLETARRTLYLSSLSDTIRHLSRPFQIEIEATHAIGVYLKASRVAYAEIGALGTLRIRHDYVNGVENNIGEFQVSDFVPAELLAKFRLGSAVMVTDVPNDSRFSETQRLAHDAAAVRSQIIVPLVKDEQLVAALIVQQSEPRNWSNEEISVVEETAERMQIAMDRAFTEGKLRESEKRFRILSNTVPSMVWTTAPDGTVLYLNDHWYQYTGLSPEESISNWAELSLHPDDYESYVASWKHALATVPDEYVQEVRYRRYDGEYRWFQSRAVPALDENGHITAWYGVSTDIHDRIEQQEELQQVINQTPFMLTRCSRDLRYRFVSQAYADMLGRAAEDVAGKAIVEIMGAEGLKVITPYVERVLQGDRVEYEAQVPFAGIGTPWLHVVYTPDHDVQGNVVGWFASIADITERKRAEEALRTSEEKYRRIVETANEGIWEIDKDARTVFVNARTAEMLGYTMDEMLGRSAFDFVFPEDHPDGEQRIERAKRGGSVSSSEFRYRRKDGSALWTLVSSSPQHDKQGNFLGSIAMIMDISERKRAEQSLIEYARRQTALYTLTDQLHRANTIENVFNSSLDAILSALQCDRASILLFDETRMMHFVAWRGLSDEYRKATDGHSPWKYGEENPLPIFYDDIATADLSESLRTVIAGEGIGSLGFIPLVFQGRLIGKFMVYFNMPHKFGESEVSLGQTIARQLASGIDRTRKEEALRQSEERFARFMKYLPGLAWIKDGQGRYVFVNAAAEKAFNAPQAQLYGRTDQEIFPPEIAAQFKQNDEQALVDGNGVQVVETLPQDDGIVHHSLVTKFPIPESNGKTSLIAGIAFDITERIQMEDALRQARERAEETADRISRLQEVTASLAGVAVPSQLAELVLEQGTRATGAAAGLLVEVINDGKEVKMIASLGYPPAAVRTDPVPLSAPTPMSDCIRNRQAIWIESHDEFAMQYPSLAESRRSFGNEATVALPLLVGDRVLGGLAFSFREKHEFLLEERGFLLAVAVQCAQGLERARAEAALHESEERYRAIVNQATAGIVRKDALGRLLFVNDAFCRMLGYDKSELINTTMWQITHEQDVQENQRLFSRLMVEGASFQLEKRLIRRDGSILWATVSVSPVLDTSGRPQSAVSVYADITERKHAEERLTLLAAISELTRSLEEPDDLMSAVAHAVGEHLRVKRCLFNEIDLENNIEVVHRDYHNGIDSVEGVHRITDYSNITTAEMVAGKTVVNHDSKTDPRTAPDYERSYVPNGERAYVAVPLMREDRWVASLWVSTDTPRQWSKNDVALLETIAERTWTATEKLRIHAALRASEERLRVTFNTTVVGFATLALDTRFVQVNDAFCKIVGYSREELLAMNSDSLTHPDYLESSRSHIAQLLAGEISSFVIEKLYLRGDGTQIWVQNSVSLLRDADGNPLNLIAICQDITERKNAEDQLHELNVELEGRVQRRTAELQSANEFLRESEATSRLILESVPDAIVITNTEGVVVHCNTQVESLFGYSPNELLGQPVEILFPKRYHQDLIHRNSLGENPTRRMIGPDRQLFGLRRSGEELPVEVALSPISNSTTWDVLVTIRDNTEQRKAQEALRVSEEKLRTLFEILPVGISFLNQNAQIIEMNSALTQILGLSKHELLQGAFKSRDYIRSDGSLMPPSEFASIRALKEQKTIYNVETGIVKENRETIWTSINAAPVKVADVEAVVVTVDITERKNAENALHKNRERLRALSRRLVEVQEDERRAIAHELHDRVGQNLAALNLNLNILRSQLSDDTLAKVGSRLTDSVQLVNDILTITRSVMADLRSNVLDDYGLESALREYADQFTQRYGIRVVADKSVSPIPRFDPSIEMTLLRIAQEALTNVARHSQASQATISLHVEGNAVKMTIQDNGVGILSWQKANQKGSHGLRIIRERTEAFGGSVQLQSAYKKGTTIEVKIPIENGNQARVSREKRS